MIAISSNTSPISLSISSYQSSSGMKYQMLDVELTSGDRIIEPCDLVGLEIPKSVDATGGVVISGRSPIWLYAYLVHELHPTKWVACFDPRLGAVVVATHCKEVKIGQIIELEPKND